MKRSMFHQTIRSAVVVVFALLQACSSPGILVMRFEPHRIPSVTSVPVDGDYGLFIAGGSEAILQFKLKQGERIGFELSQAAVVGEIQLEQVFAIAGENRLPLDLTKKYEWRRE
jgi:hypothetical protein